MFRDRLLMVQEKALMQLPASVGIVFLDYLKRVRHAYKDAYDVLDYEKILGSATLKVYNAIRDAAGIESLSKEMQDIFGER